MVEAAASFRLLSSLIERSFLGPFFHLFFRYSYSFLFFISFFVLVLHLFSCSFPILQFLFSLKNKFNFGVFRLTWFQQFISRIKSTFTCSITFLNLSFLIALSIFIIIAINYWKLKCVQVGNFAAKNQCKLRGLDE